MTARREVLLKHWVEVMTEDKRLLGALHAILESIVVVKVCRVVTIARIEYVFTVSEVTMNVHY